MEEASLVLTGSQAMEKTKTFIGDLQLEDRHRDNLSFAERRYHFPRGSPSLSGGSSVLWFDLRKDEGLGGLALDGSNEVTQASGK